VRKSDMPVKLGILEEPTVGLLSQGS
jgi:hypothetical protein